MSTYVVRLPDVGEGIAEAEILEWHVAVGDPISENDAIVDVMTDKATVELPSPVAGTVTRVGAEVGDIVAVGSELISLEVETAGTLGEETSAPEIAPPPDRSAVLPTAEASPPDRSTRPPLAAPAIRQRASDLGIDLLEVTGTGTDGRVTHRDLDELLTRSRRVAPSHPVALPDAVESIRVIGLRRNIARRMQLAKTRIPHFTYVEEIDVTELERLRAELNDHAEPDRTNLTVLPFLMLAIVRAVRDSPQVNARFDDDEFVVHRYSAVHLGVAVQTKNGLMVPVVKNADALDLWGCADEVVRLSVGARASTLRLDELGGSTITLTSLGRLGGVVSTPIINSPEVAIVGVNKIVTRPVYQAGNLVARQMMNLSSSFDHRIIDGSVAAEFIQRIKTLIETPAHMFITD